MARVLIHILVFLSGATGLVYEVAWTRVFVVAFGNTTYGVSAVLGAFMAGLALGNWLIGRHVDRKASGELRLYAFLELGIGVSSLAVIPAVGLLDGVCGTLFRAAPHEAWLRAAAQAILAFAVLFAPTFLMGGTLPVLARYLVRQPSEVAGGVGVLYGTNTAGAAVGCFAAGFLLLEHLGIRGSALLSAATNLSLAAAFYAISTTARPGEGRAATAGRTGPHPGSALLVVAAASGFAALGYEVLWTRLLVFKLKTTTYAFTAMLTTFLVGLSLGGALIGAWERRARRRSAREPWRLLGALQVGIGLCGVASVWVLGGMEDLALNASSWWLRTVQQLSLSAAVMLPPTMLMGMTLPLAARLLAVRGRGVGASVGGIYGANTAGAVLGSLACGFVLPGLLGTQTSLLTLATLNLATATLAWWAAPAAALAAGWRRRATGGAWVAAALAALALPRDLLLRLYNAGEREMDSRARLLHAREDAGGVTTVHELPSGDRVISTGSINVAGTTLTLRSTQKLQAHVPALLHPRAERVLQIGFGSGETAYLLTTYPIAALDVAEISRAVLTAADGFFRPLNHAVLGHPKVTYFIVDGANYLRLTEARYDLILNDSIWPFYAGNSGLYTLEHFTAGRARLRPGGMMTSWLPLDMPLESFETILRTFHAAFPYFSVWVATSHYTKHALLVGSLEPLSIDIPTFIDGFGAHAAEDLAAVHLGDPVLLLDCFMADEAGLEGELVAAPLHTADRPVLEFTPSKPSLQSQLAVYELLARHRSPVAGHLRGMERLGEPAREIFARQLEATQRATDHVLTARLRRERRQPGWEEELDQALALRPDHPGALLERERTAHLTRLGADALAGRSYRELLGLADRLAKAGLHGRAAAALREAIGQQPDEPRAHRDLGLALAAAGDLAGAVGALERALALDPRAADVLLALGNARRQQGDAAAAAARYREALAVDPQLAEAHYSLGTLLAEAGQVQESMAALERALALRPDYVKAHVNLGVLLDRHGRLDEAIGHFRAAAKLAPRDPAACNNLVVALAAAGQRPEALRELAAARQRGVEMGSAAQALASPEGHPPP